MNKKVMSVVIVVVVLGLVGGVWAASRHKNNNTNTMDMSSNSQSNSSSSSTATATNKVTIDNFAFSPATITIKKGTTVTWTNKDSAMHTVTESDNSTGPDSGDLATGKSYSFTYSQTGTFTYHCSIHPSMVGTVKVTD